jgi:hypothetical protein
VSGVGPGGPARGDAAEHEHPDLVNFDNDIVATKAWNRLFAVADWAASRQKRAIPPDPKPTMKEPGGKDPGVIRRGS